MKRVRLFKRGDSEPAVYKNAKAFVPAKEYCEIEFRSHFCSREKGHSGPHEHHEDDKWKGEGYPKAIARWITNKERFAKLGVVFDWKKSKTDKGDGNA